MEENYLTWSFEIRNGLASLFFDHYLMSDKAESGSDASTKTTDEVIRRCLVSWLLRQMNIENRIRFEPCVTEYTSTGPFTHPMPARLWNTLDTYYASRSEETKMILSSKLSGLRQGQPSLKDHLVKFHEAVHALRMASGTISEEDLGRKLLMSLTDFKEARQIANLNIITYTAVIKELRKRINTAEMLEGTETVNLEANTTSRRRTKCTPKKCVGTKHTPAECFRKPGNEHLMQEWEAERQRMGLWRDQSNSPSSAAVSPGQPPSRPDPLLVEALQASFDRMSLNATALLAQSSSSVTQTTMPNANTASSQPLSSLINTGATHQMFPD